MDITARVSKLDNPNSKVVGLGTIVLNGNFAVNDIKVVQNNGELFVAFPSHKGANNVFYDDCFPVDKDVRQAIVSAVLSAYNNNMNTVVKSEPKYLSTYSAVRLVEGKDNIKAYADVTLGNSFVVKGVKVIENEDGEMFVSMPSRKNSKGEYVNVAHPVTAEFNEILSNSVLKAYEREVDKVKNAQATATQGATTVPAQTAAIRR